MKKVISIFLVFCMLLALSGVAASADSNIINMLYTNEEIVAEPTVYLGELVLDGNTVMTYINCEDYISLYRYGSANQPALATVICGMDNNAFAQLVTDYQAEREALINDYYSEVISEYPSEAPCIRLCSNPDLTDSMDASWSSAAAVAAQYYPEATLTSETNENAYDVDEGFRTALAADNERREAEIGEPASAEKCVIQVYDGTSTNNVYYTVEDGQIIKHVDTTVTYQSYAITVVYTRAELSSSSVTDPADFEYRELDDGALEITNYLGTDSAVTVPAAIDGKTVTSIAADLDGYDYDVFAWQDEQYEFHSPAIINLPDTIVNIGDYAFAMCSDLTEINIPDSVTHIGDAAFIMCESLTEAVFPDSVTAIGWDTFSGCTALETVVLPDSLSEISGATFCGCTALQSVDLPSGLTAIGDMMFSGCTSLTDIVIPETVASIGQEAFLDTGLTHITVPGNTELIASTIETNIHGAEYTAYYYPVGYMTDPDTYDTVPVEGFVIRCYHDSSAEAYATECGFEIEYLDTLDGEQLVGRSISLEGDISANFYMDLDDEIAGSETANMRFTLPNGTTQDIPVGDAVKKTVGNKEYYVFKAHVAAKEMNDAITARIIDGEDQGRAYTFSVRQYADYLLSHTDIPEYAKAAPLVKAMLNYGASAQKLFGGDDPGELVNAGLTEEERTLGAAEITVDDPVETDLPEGVEFIGATLSLKSQTTLSLYFTSDSMPEFSCDGMTVKSAEVDGYKVARIRDISAARLGETFTLNVGGGTVTYSPMNYCKKVLSGSSDDVDLQNAVTALYWYQQAAAAYFA